MYTPFPPKRLILIKILMYVLQKADRHFNFNVCNFNVYCSAI